MKKSTMSKTTAGIAASLILTAGVSLQAQAADLTKLNLDNLDSIQAAVKTSLNTTDTMCSVNLDHPTTRAQWAQWFDKVAQGKLDPVSSSSTAAKAGQDLNRSQNRLVRFGAPQVVVLDFETGEPTFGVGGAFGGGFVDVEFNDYVYSQAEKDEIQSRIEADYEGFNFVFTQEVPDEGDFVFLQFNSNDDPGNTTAGILPTGGILFGRADEIDFGNFNQNTAAVIDANIWTFLFALDPSGGLISRNTGIVIDENTSPEEALSIAIVNQSANTGAHELGHTLGLRHYDAFGAPGEGLPATGQPAPDAFFPSYTGRQAGAESTLHTMASGASSGITLADSANSDRFLSERSIVKLGFNDRNRTRRPTLIEEADVRSSRFIRMSRLFVPNNLLGGINADTKLIVKSAVVKGFIEEFDEVDTYKIRARAGDIISAEVISTVDNNDDTMFPRVRIYREDRRDRSLELVAENDDEFESFDSFLLDFQIPSSGTYVIEVDAPATVQFDIDGDGVNDTVDLALFGEETREALRKGKYTLNVYNVEGK